jgi:hypothetical protein
MYKKYQNSLTNLVTKDEFLRLVNSGNANWQIVDSNTKKLDDNMSADAMKREAIASLVGTTKESIDSAQTSINEIKDETAVSMVDLATTLDTMKNQSVMWSLDGTSLVMDKDVQYDKIVMNKPLAIEKIEFKNEWSLSADDVSGLCINNNLSKMFCLKDNGQIYDTAGNVVSLTPPSQPTTTAT